MRCRYGIALRQLLVVHNFADGVEMIKRAFPKTDE
jgi:hypothetical protein